MKAASLLLVTRHLPLVTAFMNTTRVLLIRHGQSEGNAEGRFGGHSATPLSAKGRAQAEATAHALASELTAKGFGSQLLAAIFKFEGGERPVYWIYGFKRGAFWPFVPKGEKERDNAEELELKAKLEKELPIEPDLSRWFALFDAPL